MTTQSLSGHYETNGALDTEPIDRVSRVAGPKTVGARCDSRINSATATGRALDLHFVSYPQPVQQFIEPLGLQTKDATPPLVAGYDRGCSPTFTQEIGYASSSAAIVTNRCSRTAGSDKSSTS